MAKQEEVPYFDSMSDLGNPEEGRTEVMDVDPLYELSDTEYDMIATYMHFLRSLKSVIKKYSNKEEEVKIVQDLQSLHNQGEKLLWGKIAKKFKFEDVAQLMSSNVRFRLRQGNFLELYNE